MNAVMRYAARPEKTLWHGRRLVSGVNCSPQTAYNDFINTKLLYGKDSGRMYYHMTQAFPKGEEVLPETAHEMALKLAEYFEGYEVLVCTHVDREHIHSHFIINSVSFENGGKFHISTPEMEPIRMLNDSLCMKYGFEVCQPKQKQKQVRGISVSEYHTAERGQSWKFQLMNVIDDCMRSARSREEFIELMKFEGYKVRWEETRKNITYTLPNGKKCGDDKLHDDKYLKEMMEHEFRIRHELVNGRIKTEEPAAAYAAGADYTDVGAAPNREGMEHAAGFGGRGGVEFGAAEVGTGQEPLTSQRVCNEAADLESGAGADRNQDSARTGWEKERAFLFFAQTQTTSDTPVSGMVSADTNLGGIAGGLVKLGHALERDQDAHPLMRDATTAPQRHDHKKQRKLAPGQKADDHEEEQDFSMRMM